jgi:two-component system chemotaxis response regulator CheB
VINAERIKRDVIVIGASAGGVQPLKDLLELLPPNLAATVAIVLHRSPYYETRLPLVLGRHALLSVLEPADRDPVLSGAVYIAPRDQHMVFEHGMVRLSRGAREHHTRPAIDPLFRSAAEGYGARVVGALLSGMGSDGVSGLIAIKKTGGISLVQHPTEARFAMMPCTAIAEDDVDAMLTVDELASARPALTSL